MKHLTTSIIRIVRERKMTTNRLTDFDEKVKFYVNESVLEKIVGNELVIRETKENTKNSEVHVKYMRPNCYAFKMDLEPRSIYLFREMIRVNDELILWVKENKITAFILELKSNKIGKAKEQIRFDQARKAFRQGLQRPGRVGRGDRPGGFHRDAQGRSKCRGPSGRANDRA